MDLLLAILLFAIVGAIWFRGGTGLAESIWRMD
jgi:hypothetical protein